MAVPETFAALWTALGGDQDAAARLRVTGPPRVLPSVYDVTSFATAVIATATAAVAEVQALRRGRPRPPAVRW